MSGEKETPEAAPPPRTEHLRRRTHFMVSSKSIKSGVNGVAVARHGLIFGEDGATGSRKVSGYLRDLQDTI